MTRWATGHMKKNLAQAFKVECTEIQITIVCTHFMLNSDINANSFYSYGLFVWYNFISAGEQNASVQLCLVPSSKVTACYSFIYFTGHYFVVYLLLLIF